MRKLFLKTSISISIFLLVFGIAVILAVPLYNHVSVKLRNSVENVSKTIVDKTGILVSYKSLSPSIFNGLNIRGVILYDEDIELPLCQIKRINLRYSLGDFFKGKGIAAIKDLTIDGFTLDVNKTLNEDIVQKLGELFSPESEVPSEKNQQKKEAKIDFEKISSQIPFDVFFKNVFISYENDGFKGEAHLKKITIAYRQESKNLFVDTNGSFNYSSSKLLDSLKGNFSAQGNLPEKLDGSSLMFRLSDINYSDYSVSRLNLLFGYNKKVFDVRTVQNGYPLYIHGSYNLEDSQAQVVFNTKKLKPGNIIVSKKYGKTMRKIRNLTVDIGAEGKFNSKQKTLSYSTKGNVYVPKEIYKGGFNSSFEINGNENKVNVKKLNASGENIDVDVGLSYFFKGMRLSGEADLNRIVLGNGGVISTSVYFDPQKTGFMAFAPQLMMGENSLTGIQVNFTPQKDSYDFTFEVSDYSHQESDVPGVIKINGSYLEGTKYVQVNLGASGLFLDSVAQTANFFVRKKDSAENKFAMLSNYMFNGEMYFSTDLKSLSYNVPYAFVANTKNDSQFVYLSLDGNGTAVQLYRLDYISSGKMVHAEGQYDKSPDLKDDFFTLDITADKIPYHVNGSIMQGNLNVSGDYGLSLEFAKKGLSKYEGGLTFDNLPLSVAGGIFTCSLDAAFSYSESDGINVQLVKLEGAEESGKLSFNPRLFMAGEATKYGANISTITYSDLFSSLDGSSQVTWNINDSGFDSAHVVFDLKNPLSSEEIEIDADITSQQDEGLYVNGQVSFNVFGLNRFTAERSENNSLTAKLIATGPITNPYVGIDIENLTLMTAGNTISASGLAYMEEQMVTVDSFSARYNDLSLSETKAKISIKDFTGKLSTVVNASVAGETVKAPFVFTISETLFEEGKKIPSEFVANLSSEKVGGSFFPKPFPLNVGVVHSSKNTMIYTDETQGVMGTISNDGEIHFSVAEGKPLQMNVDGNIAGNSLDIAIKNINADLGVLLGYMELPVIKAYEGILKGSLKITGLKSDPEFMGALSLGDADFSLKGIVPSHITVPKTIVTFNHNRIQIPQTSGLVKKQCPVNADLDVVMDRWSLGKLTSHVWFPKNSYGPGDVDARLARFTGDANIDLMITFEDGILDVSGDIKVKNLIAQVIARELTKSGSDTMPMRLNLNILFGPHVTFRFDPLIRAIFVPDSEFTYKFDSTDGSLKLNGELALRSGDISYLNRSFYLKKGSMKFNANDPTFNPLITVQAETRERDEDGNDIRIILTANNQYLLNFNPQFTSIPARSESDIRSMLGQIALADSDNVSSLLLSAGDYAVQSLVTRNIENKLRDFLNFDILSIRTNVLQNALKQGFSNGFSFSGNKNLEIGNYLDNSTVYIGKYFGSDLYVDALMHWSYDDSRVNDTLTIGGLVFKPELGFELESPFVNIRWNMAPDIDAMMNSRIVSSTSVTLSWSFSF